MAPLKKKNKIKIKFADLDQNEREKLHQRIKQLETECEIKSNQHDQSISKLIEAEHMINELKKNMLQFQEINFKLSLMNNNLKTLLQNVDMESITCLKIFAQLSAPLLEIKKQLSQHNHLIYNTQSQGRPSQIKRPGRYNIIGNLSSVLEENSKLTNRKSTNVIQSENLSSRSRISQSILRCAEYSLEDNLLSSIVDRNFAMSQTPKLSDITQFSKNNIDGTEVTNRSTSTEAVKKWRGNGNIFRGIHELSSAGESSEMFCNVFSMDSIAEDVAEIQSVPRNSSPYPEQSPTISQHSTVNILLKQRKKQSVNKDKRKGRKVAKKCEKDQPPSPDSSENVELSTRNQKSVSTAVLPNRNSEEPLALRRSKRIRKPVEKLLK